MCDFFSFLSQEVDRDVYLWYPSPSEYEKMATGGLEVPGVASILDDPDSHAHIKALAVGKGMDEERATHKWEYNPWTQLLRLDNSNGKDYVGPKHRGLVSDTLEEFRWGQYVPGFRRPDPDRELEPPKIGNRELKALKTVMRYSRWWEWIHLCPYHRYRGILRSAREAARTVDIDEDIGIVELLDLPTTLSKDDPIPARDCKTRDREAMDALRLLMCSRWKIKYYDDEDNIAVIIE